jgi:hypothetical protein
MIIKFDSGEFCVSGSSYRCPWEGSGDQHPDQDGDLGFLDTLAPSDLLPFRLWVIAGVE